MHPIVTCTLVHAGMDLSSCLHVYYIIKTGMGGLLLTHLQDKQVVLAHFIVPRRIQIAQESAGRTRSKNS